MKECTACKACLNVCTNNAISFKKDKFGFEYPFIDEDKCKHCGLCDNVCPIKNKLENKNNEVKEFKAVTSNKEISNNSSTAGIFYLLSDYVLKNNGIVFGAAFKEDFSVHHISVDNYEDLEKLRMSKYIQSDIEYSYKDCKNYLQEGKLVLFSGTPCQIAGLKSFLNKDYDNLITIDLLCHGICSYDELKLFLDSENINIADIKNIYFRNKEKLESYLKIELKDGSEKVYNHDCLFYKFFLKDDGLRDSCYTCDYNSLPRQGDFTIGDLWSYKEYNLPEDKISIMLTNNNKAEIIWNKITENNKEIKSKIFTIDNKVNKNVYKNNTLKNNNHEEFKKLNLTNSNIKNFYNEFDTGLVIWDSDNYGSICTNFALYNLLLDLGKSPVVLENKSHIEPYAKLCLPYIGMKSISNTDDYYNKNLNTFITGSDCTIAFNEYWQNNKNNNLLNFASHQNKKLGVACSSGGELLNKDDLALLKGFDYIATREKISDDIDTMLDPVFLIDKEKYNSIIERSTLNINENFNFCYILRPNENTEKEILDYFKDSDLPIKIILSRKKSNKQLKYFNKLKDNVIVNAKVSDWLNCIKNSEYVYTDSFHGICFSIIYKKTFYCYETGLGKRLNYLIDLLNIDVNNIDYAKIFNSLNDLKNKSIDKLKLELNKEKSLKKVSAIIPAYNAEKTIIRCINSILSQSYSNFEVIVVDDGSTDNTFELLSTIKDERVKIIKHDVNKGVCAARNTGLDNVTGDYVTFIDSDDYLINDSAFVKYVSIFEDYSIDMIKINTNNLPTGIINVNNIGNNYYIGYTWSMIWRFNTIKQNRFPVNTGIRTYEELPYTVSNLNICNNIYVINNNYYKYDRTYSYLTKLSLSYDEKINILNYYNNIIIDNNIKPSLKQNVLKSIKKHSNAWNIEYF